MIDFKAKTPSGSFTFLDLIDICLRNQTLFAMKNLPLIAVILTVLTVGCDNAPAQNNKYGNHEMKQAVPYQNDNPSSNNGQRMNSPISDNENIIMHPVSNPKTNATSMLIPLPASWQMNSKAPEGKPYITGPDGLEIYSYSGQNYIHTTNPYMHQAYQSSGTAMAPPAGIDNVVTQQLIPYGRQNGLQLINQYPLPQVAGIDAAYVKSITLDNGPTINRAAGTDWIDQNGKKVFIVLHYYEMGSPDMVNWGYHIQVLKVLPRSFEKSKDYFVNGLVKAQFNQNEINAFKNNLANKIGESERHASAMRQINTEGAQQRMEMNSATDAHVSESHAATRDARWADQDAVQEQTGDYFSDQYRVISPFDGKEYTVESGSQTYWINDRGVYIKSDDVNFDPNNYETHPGVWQRAPRKKY